MTRWGAGQEPEQTGLARHTVTHDGIEGGSVLATLARSGTAQTVELVPGQPWTRTTVEVALREGILVRGPGGALQEPPKAAAGAAPAAAPQGSQEATQQAQQSAQQGDELAGVFDPEEDAAFGADMEAVPQHVFASAVGAGVRDMVLGGDFAAAAARLAESGMEPAQAAERVENARWYFQQIADRAIAKVGVVEELRDAFYADLRQNPGQLQDALQYLTRGRDVSRFQTYAREWLSRQDVKGSRL